MKTIVFVCALALIAFAPLAQANGDVYSYDPPPAPQPAPRAVYVQPPPPVKAPGDWYAGVYGGANWADDFGTTFGPISIDSNTDTGTIVGVFVGKKIPSAPGLSFELDASLRQNDVNLGVTFIAPPPIFTIPGDDRTIALMANGRYEFLRDGRLTPYIYAGVGYGERTISLDLIPILLTFEKTKSDLVWQAGAGVDVRLTEDIKAGVRYTYFDGVDFSQNIGPVAFGADGQDHSVSAVLTFALN